MNCAADDPNDGAEEIAQRKLNLAQRALFRAGGMLKVTDSAQAIQGRPSSCGCRWASGW